MLTFLFVTFGRGMAQKAERMESIADTVIIQDMIFTSSNLPKDYHFDTELGLILHKGISGKVVHRNYEGGIRVPLIAKWPNQMEQSKNRILFANPDSRMNPWKAEKQHFDYSTPNRRRENLTLRMSYDEGLTWPVKKVLEPGISGYSDLAILPDGSILCLYEKGGMGDNHFKTAVLTLANYPEQ